MRLGNLAILASLLALSCGGSASETPWPAEPIDLEPGPAGERRERGNVIDTSKLPDNYNKKKKPVKEKEPVVPEEDDETIDEEEAPETDEEEDDAEVPEEGAPEED